MVMVSYCHPADPNVLFQQDKADPLPFWAADVMDVADEQVVKNPVISSKAFVICHDDGETVYPVSVALTLESAQRINEEWSATVDGIIRGGYYFLDEVDLYSE